MIEISSPSSSSSSSTFVAGGRALDRHNPIITDEKRSGIASDPTTPLGTPRTHHVLQQKPKSPFTPTTTKTAKNKHYNKLSLVPQKSPLAGPGNKSVDDFDTTDLVMKAVACNPSKPNVDYISAPESSRYLLDDDDDTSFLDSLSGFDDPVLKSGLNDDGGGDSKNVEVTDEVDGSSSCGKSDQVVVLRVSLHCRGCERKMKKHLSKMSGVTSFNVDFVAKKVTVIGDVTPLQVLANISKVKTAKLWSPPNIVDTINTNTVVAQI